MWPNWRGPEMSNTFVWSQKRCSPARPRSGSAGVSSLLLRRLVVCSVNHEFPCMWLTQSCALLPLLSSPLKLMTWFSLAHRLLLVRSLAEALRPFSALCLVERLFLFYPLSPLALDGLNLFFFHPSTHSIHHVGDSSRLLILFRVRTALWVGSALLPRGRARYKQLSDPQSKRPRPASTVCLMPGLELLLVAHVPVSSCTVPRRHGRINHEPEDVSQGGFGQDLPHYPPMSHGSSRFEVDEKALRKRVSLRPLCGPPRVAAVVFLTTCVLCSTLCSTPCAQCILKRRAPHRDRYACKLVYDLLPSAMSVEA